jgi:hypothetical protein
MCQLERNVHGGGGDWGRLAPKMRSEPPRLAAASLCSLSPVLPDSSRFARHPPPLPLHRPTPLSLTLCSANPHTPTPSLVYPSSLACSPTDPYAPHPRSTAPPTPPSLPLFANEKTTRHSFIMSFCDAVSPVRTKRRNPFGGTTDSWTSPHKSPTMDRQGTCCCAAEGGLSCICCPLKTHSLSLSYLAL